MKVLSEKLDAETLKIIKECLHAAADGPFFPDWEFHTLFGVEREIVRAVYEVWPEQKFSDEDFRSAVIGAMNNLTGYPHGQERIWKDYISVPPERVVNILETVSPLLRG